MLYQPIKARSTKETLDQKLDQQLKVRSTDKDLDE